MPAARTSDAIDSTRRVEHAVRARSVDPDGVADQSQVYFTHSYVAPLTSETVAVANTASFRRRAAGEHRRRAVSSREVWRSRLEDSSQLRRPGWLEGLLLLSKRIIACLDVRNGQVVKGVNFEGLRSAGDPAELARRYNAEGIDELVILDITATMKRGVRWPTPSVPWRASCSFPSPSAAAFARRRTPTSR
jgi:hypothetical protein